jgi:predicted RNA polymerase sigma factor
MGALQAHVEPDFVDALAEANADDIGDDLLRLVFTACHPLLPTEGRVALTVRLLGGLATDEIARAFLVPEATIAQRIVRAKRTLAAAKVPFEVPDASERRRGGLGARGRLPDLPMGYSATAGDDWCVSHFATRCALGCACRPGAGKRGSRLVLMELVARAHAASTRRAAGAAAEQDRCAGPC